MYHCIIVAKLCDDVIAMSSLCNDDIEAYEMTISLCQTVCNDDIDAYVIMMSSLSKLM